MSNAEPVPLPPRTPGFSPLIEQAILFTLFAGGAGFWMAVIWWILR